MVSIRKNCASFFIISLLCSMVQHVVVYGETLRNSAQQNIPMQEYNALFDLFNSTNGANWNFSPNKVKWNFTSPYLNFPCADHWQGIQCVSSADNSSVNIEKLELLAMGLDGSLPNSLGDFQNMTELSISVNFITSTIPEGICSLSTLTRLELTYNRISSPIPNCLTQLTAVTDLILNDNQLYGSLPENIGDMVSLESLYLYRNFLNGTIPQSIGNLQSFVTFYAGINALSGSIPASITKLASLRNFDIGDNELTGEIPESIGDMQQLQLLFLFDNKLGGTIPESLYTMTGLTTLKLDQNQLIGTISDNVGAMQGLFAFVVSGNQLHGTIPVTFDQLSRSLFVSLNLDNNYLTGTLPASFSNLTELRYIEVQHNLLHGSVPNSYCSLLSLNQVDFSNNQFTGTLPYCLGEASHINQLYVQFNSFSGLIPQNLHVGYFTAQNNQMTGTLDEFFCSGQEVYQLNLDQNHFSGTLSSCVGSKTTMSQMQVCNNVLSGSLPSALSTLEQLETLFLSTNRFTGDLGSVFNSTAQGRIINVDVSANQLTGHVPPEVFLIPGIQSFAAVSNCFSGELPIAEMCAAETLITLALDGLMSASSCQHRFFAGWTGIDSYWLRQEFTDHLPACLFELPKLNILHLSGNGFVSSIPQSANLSSNLVDLSLSNNKLKGLIPSNVQRQEFINLDLSYNKLSGTLRSDYPAVQTKDEEFPDGTLSLQVNRLSGAIPSVLRSAAVISLLDGNLFACSPDRSELPVHDSSVNEYECGSTTLNYALYVWIGIGCAVVIASVLLLYFNWAQLQGTLDKFRFYLYVYHMGHISNSDEILQFGSFLSELRKFFLVVVAALFAATLVVNTTLSVFFNSYAYEYAWNIASVYLSGTTPAIVLFWLYLAAAVFVVYSGRLCNFGTSSIHQRLSHAISSRKLDSISQSNINSSNVSDSSSSNRNSFINSSEIVSWPFSRYLHLTLSVLFNVAVIVGVNMAYVFVNQTCSYDAVQATQVALSVFKVAWNNLAVRAVLRQMKQYTVVDRERQSHIRHSRFEELQQFATAEEAQDYKVGSDSSETSVHSLEIAVFIMLFNNIAAPFIAIALVNSNCFYNVITTPPAVNVSYLYASCKSYTVETSAFQCLVYEYGTDSRETSYIPPFTYSYQCSSAFITTYAPVYILMFIIMTFVSPAALALLKYAHSRAAAGSPLHTSLSKMLPNILKPVKDTVHHMESYSAGSSGWESTIAMSLLDVVFSKQLFDCDVFVVQVVSILAVALTFGVVFPPILVVACVALLTVTYCTQLLIGRYVHHLQQYSQSHPELDLRSIRSTGIDSDVSHAKHMFVSSVWIVVPFAVVFYSFLLFDILGDEVGWKKAVWMPVVLIAFSSLLFMLWPCRNVRCGSLCPPVSTTAATNAGNKSRSSLETRLLAAVEDSAAADGYDPESDM